jgi:hypothetical protein
MLERLYIKQLESLLDCDDYRTVYSWCESNGVGILTDTGNRKKKYVLKIEFEKAYNKEGERYFKEKYGEDKLTEVFNNTTNALTQNNHRKAVKANEYKPQGEFERIFLNDLQNC